MVVGQTKNSGYQAGARKTLNVAPGALWTLVVGAAGQQALGGTLSSTTAGVTTFVAGSHYRQRVADGVLQVRVVPATRGRATLALHMEQLVDEATREHVLARFTVCLDTFAVLCS